MNTKPILFSGEMVRQILAGNKTQTRRLVNPQPERGIMPCAWVDSGWAYEAEPNEHGVTGCTCKPVKGTVYNIDDLLWVRETWASHQGMDDTKPSEFTAGAQMLPVWYRADGQGNTERGRWRPSIHMPRWASRITLCVTDVQVERLWEMSVYKMEAEGVSEIEDGNHPLTPFIRLWNGINGRRKGCAWEDNPWVWVIEFERVT